MKSASKTDKTKNSRVSLKFYSQSMEDVVKRFNAIKPLSLLAEEGFFKRGENAILDSIPWEVGKRISKKREGIILLMLKILKKSD